jgi:hypothetical protein
MRVDIEEGDRQLIILALAILGLRRPGWNETLCRIAEKFGKENAVLMFDQFQRVNKDNEPIAPVSGMPDPKD